MVIYVIIASLLFSAFFSGMEIAFISANRLRIELDKKQGSFSSRIISVFSKNPSQYIATMLVGNNVALVMYGLFMAILLKPLLYRFTQSEPGLLLLQTIISTMAILITGEFMPKVIFRINPNRSLNIFSVPVLIVYIVFYPVAWLTIAISSFFIGKVLRKPVNTKLPIAFNKVDISHLVEEKSNEETHENVESHELKIFQNALDFSSLKVRDCMIPRTDIEAMEAECSIAELKEKFIETGFSKILIYKESIDNIIGYVNLKSLYNNPTDIQSILLKISFVPETMQASKLLQQLIKDHKSVAAVVDEFGGISGMLTIEDIIEEIFGEIEDEHDTPEFIERKVKENEYIFSGRLEIDYLNEKYSLHMPESEDYDTLAGFIIYHTEKIPLLNEQITIDHFQFRILKVTVTRVDLVSLAIKP
ncbi:MAG: HlyC/CorC family transporter [Bacteroidales bacterium]|nr:HlyC/CorC family transporter [Bacteroidales bacterium]